MNLSMCSLVLLFSISNTSIFGAPHDSGVPAFFVPIKSDITVTGNLVVLGTINGLPLAAFTGLGNATSANIPNTIVMRDATASFGVTNIGVTGTINTQSVDVTSVTVSNDLNVIGTISATDVNGGTISALNALIFPVGVSDSVAGLQLNGHANTGFWENGNALTLTVNGNRKFDTDGGTVHLYGAPLKMYGQNGQQILLQADSTINMVANAVPVLDVSSTQITAHVPMSTGSVSATNINSSTVSAPTVSGGTVNATGQVVSPAGSAGSPGLVLQGINNTGFYTVGGSQLNFKVNNNIKLQTDGSTLNIYGNPINLYGGIGNVFPQPALSINGFAQQAVVNTGVYTIPNNIGMYMISYPGNVNITLNGPTSPVVGQLLTIATSSYGGAFGCNFTFNGNPYVFTTAGSAPTWAILSFTYYYNGSSWITICRS